MAPVSKVSVHRFTHPLRLATFCQTIPNHRTPPIPRFRPDLFFDRTRSLHATFTVFDIIAVDERDEIFLPDLQNHRIRKLTPIRE
jgi:hypothetical protein